jgi:hypothetical protein
VGRRHCIRPRTHVDTLFSSPIETEQARIISGRSPDSRVIEMKQPSQSLRSSGYMLRCFSLGVYSYGVVTESHRLPEHQMIEDTPLRERGQRAAAAACRVQLCCRFLAERHSSSPRHPEERSDEGSRLSPMCIYSSCRRDSSLRSE